MNEISINLADEQVSDLAQPLVQTILGFFSDKKREEDFQKWLANRNAVKEEGLDRQY